MSAPNTQQKNNSIGALILIVLTAIAIIAALILGGIQLFGQNSEPPSDEPTGAPTVDPMAPDFKVEAWPSDNPLSGYELLSGALILPTEDYQPPEGTLQKIVKNGQFLADDIQMDKDANAALIRMLSAMNNALKFDENIMVHTAYKETLDRDYRSGMTVRFRLVRNATEYCYLAEATGDNPVTWLEENAWKYGFVLRYPKGNAVDGKESGVSDVYRYVGVPHAYYITHELTLADGEGEETGATVPTLEDYIELAKKATAKNPIAFEVKRSGSDNGVYNVYYVAASDADKALIREGAELYSVSGVGDGYIVTSYFPADDTDAEDDGASSEEQSEESTEEND